MLSLRLFFRFVEELVSKRHLIWELTKRDFKSRYLGSYLGIIWAFVHPTLYIVIISFIFTFVFKGQNVSGVPYVVWLVLGITPWFFFSDALSSATGSIVENTFLVKKIAFSIAILPLVKILSALLIHLFYIMVIFILLFAYKIPLGIHSVQIVYYMFGMLVLLMGMSWLTSSLVVFLKDVGQLVAVLLQFLFWGTPIFWLLDVVPERYQLFLKLNPVVYFVEGYRQSFLDKVWFWEHALQTMYFWGVTLFILLLGTKIFIKLRPHFNDVL